MTSPYPDARTDIAVPDGLRDLPWRRTRDPWRILVSEVMLQQTGVERVVPGYLAFVEEFPTPAACASVSVGYVVRQWAGLGFNRRARNLHRAATEIVTRYDGRVPDQLDALLELPGVGPYTARAVLAFAFERDVGVVDVNAARVLARFNGRTMGRAEVQVLADAQVPPGGGWYWNQAMLDHGALVCTARRPKCADCSLRADCAWRSDGGVDPALGSGGISAGQSPFEGSDRQGRGRLVDALRAGPVPLESLPEVMGWPGDPVRAREVAAKVVADGLATVTDGVMRLPD